MMVPAWLSWREWTWGPLQGPCSPVCGHFLSQRQGLCGLLSSTASGQRRAHPALPRTESSRHGRHLDWPGPSVRATQESSVLTPAQCNVQKSVGSTAWVATFPAIYTGVLGAGGQGRPCPTAPMVKPRKDRALYEFPFPLHMPRCSKQRLPSHHPSWPCPPGFLPPLAACVHSGVYTGGAGACICCEWLRKACCGPVTPVLALLPSTYGTEQGEGWNPEAALSAGGFSQTRHSF